jgi:hypothetical protein
MEVSDQPHFPAALFLGRAHSTHCTGGWVGPKASLDILKNSLLLLAEIDPWTIEPAA